MMKLRTSSFFSLFQAQRKIAKNAAGLLLWDSTSCFGGEIGVDHGHRVFSEAVRPVHLNALRTFIKPWRFLVLGFSSDAGVLEGDTIRWLRGQAKETFSVAEQRALIREAGIRAQENIRRRGWTTDTARFVGLAVENMRFDGRRIMSPIGLSGKELTVRITSVFLYPDAEAFLATAREAAGRVPVYPIFDDQATAWGMFYDNEPDAFVFLDRFTTTVSIFRNRVLARRSVLAIGQGSAVKALQRALKLSSEKESYRILFAAVRGHMNERARRKVETALTPLFMQWVQAVAHSGLSRLPRHGEIPLVYIVSVERLLPPFAKALAPRVLKRVFQESTNVEFHIHQPEDDFFDNRFAHLASLYSALVSKRSLPVFFSA